jgi:hypothetical protein
MAGLATIFDRVAAVAFPVNFRIYLQHAQSRTCLPVPRLRGSLARSRGFGIAMNVRFRKPAIRKAGCWVSLGFPLCGDSGIRIS